MTDQFTRRLTGFSPAGPGMDVDSFVHGGKRIRLVSGSIVEVVADAMVSSDDNYLTMSGGVSAALRRTAGEDVYDCELVHVRKIVDDYRQADTPIPATMRRWHLYGAGLENLGRDGKPETVPVPDFGPDELLVRQDACGLCFSDTKVIAQGAAHPRMTGRMLTVDPCVLGHEVACTVVAVGSYLREKYHVGERFVIQADVFYRGKGMAYGYAIPGGLSEYSVIPPAILDGDEGCYLLPVRAETGYVEAALTEPWACVVSAYHQAHRDGLKLDGRLLIIGSGQEDERQYDWTGLFSPDRKPAFVALSHISVLAKQRFENQTSGLGLTMSVTSAPQANAQVTECATSSPTNNKQQTTNNTFDDILILGNVAPDVIEQAATLLADHGILNLVCDRPLPRLLALDIGRIHYNWHHYIGTRAARPADAYRETRTAELLPGGICWFVGAGGPMGQMHVQRALQHAAPPARIIATDVDADRLQSVADRFGAMAQARGIELFTLNPNDGEANAFDAELRRLSHWDNREGFDDIVSLVPSAAATAYAARFLAPGGWLNIFAGVARGTLADLDMNRIAGEHCRVVGSTGSSLADMRAVLTQVEQDTLDTSASLAAIGGLEAAAEGLRAVKEGWFAGKTLIFPTIHDLPLTPLAQLETTLPTVYARLQDGRFWTRAAEDELLRLKF